MMFRKCPVCDAEATWTDEGLQQHIRGCADSLRARLTAAEAAIPKWVKVEEQEPPESGHQGDTVSEFVQVHGIAKYHYPTGTWCWINLEKHWQPLPQPPGKEE